MFKKYLMGAELKLYNLKELEEEYRAYADTLSKVLKLVTVDGVVDYSKMNDNTILNLIEDILLKSSVSFGNFLSERHFNDNANVFSVLRRLTYKLKFETVIEGSTTAMDLYGITHLAHDMFNVQASAVAKEIAKREKRLVLLRKYIKLT